MPIQTAEADKRLPVDESRGFADTGFYAPGNRAGPVRKPALPLPSGTKSKG